MTRGMPKSEESTSPAEIEAALRGVSYPCSKDDLIDNAHDQGAPAKVMDFLEELPDKEYHSPIDVTKEMSGQSLKDEF